MLRLALPVDQLLVAHEHVSLLALLLCTLRSTRLVLVVLAFLQDFGDVFLVGGQGLFGMHHLLHQLHLSTQVVLVEVELFGLAVGRGGGLFRG